MLLFSFFSFGCFEPEVKKPPTNTSIVVVNITAVNETTQPSNFPISNSSLIKVYTPGPVSVEFLSLCNNTVPGGGIPGGAIFISGNGKRILIDTGSLETYSELNKDLRSEGAIHVDYLILTSDTSDRIGGLVPLLSGYNNFTNNIVYNGELQIDGALYKNKIQKLSNNQNLCVNGICVRYIYGPTSDGIFLVVVQVYGRSILLGPDLTPFDISDITNKNLGKVDVLEFPSFGYVSYHNSKTLQKYITTFAPKQFIATGCATPITQRNFLDKYVYTNFNSTKFYKTYRYSSNVIVFINPDGQYSVVYKNE